MPVTSSTTSLDPVLAQLAEACSVSVEFHDWQGRPRPASPDTLRAVLKALGIDASTPEAARAALDEVRLAPWRRTLPPSVVVRSGSARRVPVHVPHGEPVTLSVRLEEGGERELHQVDAWVQPREVDGILVGEATFEVPGDLPIGYHELRAAGGASGTASLIVVPAYVGDPPSLGSR